MIKASLRTLAAIVLGLLAAFVLVVAVEGFSAVVHPFPDDFGGTDEELYRHVANYPQWVLAAAIPMWAVAALVGTWVAHRIGNLYAVAMVALLLLSALVCNLAMLPYPIWFKVASLLAIPAAIVAGTRFPGRRRTAGPGEVN